MCCETIFGYDTDDLFSYQTIKVVRIRDRRLGILRLSLLLLIFVYIVIFKIVGQNGYLKMEPPIGTMRFSLLRPLADPRNDRPEDRSAFRPQWELPYCQAYNGSHPVAYRFDCEYQDAVDVFTTMERSAMIATRVTESTEHRICDTEATQCSYLWNQTQPRRRFYVADLESYTMLLDHTVQAASLDVHASARTLKGLIEVPEGHDWLCARDPTASVKTSPCKIRPNDTSPPTGLDIFNVDTILEIVFDQDTTLDHLRELDNSTYRDDGIVLVLEIKYHNFKPWSGVEAEVGYTYKFNRLLDTNYKEESATYNVYPTDRVWRDRHGIKIVVLQTGLLGQFDVTTLLVQLTTSLTLLALATFVVDVLALRFLPQREDYTKAKIEVTEDFSDLRNRRLAHEDEGAVAGDYRSMEQTSAAPNA